MQIDLDSITVTPNTPILDVIKVIDHGSIGAALVIRDGKLAGIATDGDIRRGILKQVDLNLPISKVMNNSPIVAPEGLSRSQLLSLLHQNQVLQIPVISEIGNVVGVETIDNLVTSTKKKNVVVLMAGGLGSRLRPLTDECPKPLLPVGGKPMLETIIDGFVEHGFTDFLIAVNYKKEMIMDYFGNGNKWGTKIQYLEEDKRLGTAGPLSLIKQKIDSPFFVMNGDIMSQVNYSQMLDFHRSQQALATMCVRQVENTIPYGVVTTEDCNLLNVVEKPRQSYFVNAGIYLLEPALLDRIPKDEFYDMPDLFNTLIKENQKSAVFPLREYWLDIGRKEDFDRAHNDYGEMFHA